MLEASLTIFFRKLVKRVDFFGISISFSHISILNVNRHIFSQSIQIWFILQLCESCWLLFVVFSVARKQGQTDSAGKYNFKCHPAAYRRNAQGKWDRRHAKYWVYWQTVKWHEYEFWRGVWWIWRSTKIPTSKWVKLVNRTLFYLMLKQSPRPNLLTLLEHVLVFHVCLSFEMIDQCMSWSYFSIGWPWHASLS